MLALAVVVPFLGLLGHIGNVSLSAGRAAIRSTTVDETRFRAAIKDWAAVLDRGLELIRGRLHPVHVFEIVGRREDGA